MARKKKNPLGDFEDALSSLGFGGQEGGDSVTDIDNQDVVNQVLDDPNDDIDNLDGTTRPCPTLAAVSSRTRSARWPAGCWAAW